MIKRKIILTVGLIASGKTTWSKQYVKDNPNTYRVSRDDLRFMTTDYQYTPENEKNIDKIYRGIIENLLLNTSKDIICDEQNLNKDRREEFKKWLLELNPDLEIIEKEFPITLGEAIERDRNRVFSIGEKVIKSTWRRYETILQDMITRSKPKFKFNEDLPKAYIFDIDGSVALKGDRSIYDGSKAYLDIPIIPVISVAQSLLKNGYKIIFLSGRDSRYYDVTYEWLLKYFNVFPDSFLLYMRKENDNRQDAIIKKEIFLEKISNNFNILGIFDDRPQVLRLWQNDLGIWTFALNQDVDCKNDF